MHISLDGERKKEREDIYATVYKIKGIKNIKQTNLKKIRGKQAKKTPKTQQQN